MEARTPPDAPQAGTADFDDAFIKYLNGPRATAALQDSILNFALQHKASEAISQYLATRVFPTAVVIAAVLAYFGWSIAGARESAEEQVRLVAAQKKTLEAELAKVEATMEAARHNVAQLDRQSRDTLDSLRGEAERQRHDINRSADLGRSWALETDQRIRKEGNDLYALNAKVAGIDARLAELGRLAADAETKVKSGRELAADLTALTALQGRVIGAALIEYVILGSGARSAVIELPRVVGSYKLQFETPNIKEHFDLAYRVDGIEQRLRISNADKGNWNPIVGTQGLYEFRVDHVLYVKGGAVHDFVALRVRASRALTLAEVRSHETGRRDMPDTMPRWPQ